MGTDYEGEDGTLTPTPNPNSTVFSFVVCPHGLGNCGDNVNPLGGNTNPLHTTKNFTVMLTDTNNHPVPGSPFPGQLTYLSASQNFQGTLAIPQLPPGQYLLNLKMRGYLGKQIPNVITVSQGQQVTLPPISLVTGDITTDNQLDIFDYNVLIGCFGTKATSPTCLNKTASDINDDGTIDGIDLNLFLRELSVQHGQ